MTTLSMTVGETYTVTLKRVRGPEVSYTGTFVRRGKSEYGFGEDGVVIARDGLPHVWIDTSLIEDIS